MNINTVKTENGNVSCETPEGTVVHINIIQRSAFDCLLDTRTFHPFQDMRKSGVMTKPSSTPGSAAHLGSGAAYISSGVVSVMLAVMFCILRTDFIIFYTGVHFWVGFLFIVSGILNLVAYKFPKTFWMALAFIFSIASFGVSIAGTAIAANDMKRLGWFGNERVCDNLLKGSDDYFAKMPPRQNMYNYDYDLRTCKDAFQKNKQIEGGLVIMTLLMMIWGLCLSIVSVCCRVKSCCSSCSLELAEEDYELLKSDPPDNLIIA